MSQYDVLCIGNAIVDIIAQCDDKFLVENGIIKGAMNLDRHRARGSALQPHGAGDRGFRRLRRQHGGRHRQFRRPRRLLRQGLGRSARAGSSATTSTRRASPSTPSRSRRPADGALHDLRHAGRRALDEHLSRRLRRARPRGCRGRQGGWREGHLFRGLSVGPAARQGGDPADGAATPTRPAAKFR